MPLVATTTLGALMSAEPGRGVPVRDRRRRRLTQVVGRHADRSRPFIVSVHTARQPLQPYEDTVVLRSEWRGRYLGRDETVLITYLPEGGSAGKIGLAIAAIALIVVAPYIAGPAVLGLTGFAATAVTAGLVIGGTALLSLATRSKADKKNTDTRPVYGASGGGNLPRPGDRIPRLYGRCWTQPDLAQDDFSLYAGDNTVLHKRMVISAGKVSVKAVRAGQQVVWTQEDGYQAPFTAQNAAFEVLHGEASTLVPSDVIGVSAVSGSELPRPTDSQIWAGPFEVNRTGALINTIVVSYAFPQGIGASYVKSGKQIANAPGLWGLRFEYAPIDEAGDFTGPWQLLIEGNSSLNGLAQSSRPLRYSSPVAVPPGRYAVRGRNIMVDDSQNPVGQNVNTVTWDGLVGFVPDTRIRTNVTEIAMRLVGEKATQNAAFGQIDVEAQAIVPVLVDGVWVEQETSKAVWAWCDVLREGRYGGGLPDGRVDSGSAAYYAALLDEFDTFDGVIRGPVSLFQAAATVLLPMRAEPTNLGRVWSLVRDEPKDVASHVITRRQIAKGSTSLGYEFDATGGAAHVIGEFDRDGDFRAPDQTPDVIYGEASLTPTRVRWQGVRSFDHAVHLTRWKGLIGFYRRKKASFSTRHDARIYARGDAIKVDAWFGRAAKVAAVVDRAGDTLELDADVAIAAGDYVILRDRRGREWGPVLIASQGASLREILLSPVSRALAEQSSGQTLGTALAATGEDTVAFVGPLTTLSRRYIVRSVRPASRDRNDVEALFDDPRVWEGLGITVPTRPPITTGLRDPQTVTVGTIRGASMQGAASRYVQWTLTPPRGADLFRVALSYDGGNNWTPIAETAETTGTAELMPTTAAALDIRAQARASASGLWGTWTYGSFASGGDPILAYDLEIALEQIEQAVANVLSDDPDIAGSIGAAKAAAEAANVNATQAVMLARDLALDGDVREAAFETLLNLISAQDGYHTETLANATTSLKAGIDEQGRAIAEQKTILSAQTASTTARFIEINRVVADDRSSTSFSLISLDGRVTTADAKAVTAQGTADSILALTISPSSVLAQRFTSLAGSITTAQNAANAADAKAVVAQGKAQDLLDLNISPSSVLAGRFTTLSGSITTAQNAADAAQGTANTANYNAAVAQGTANDILALNIGPASLLSQRLTSLSGRIDTAQTAADNAQGGANYVNGRVDDVLSLNLSPTSALAGKITSIDVGLGDATAHGELAFVASATPAGAVAAFSVVLKGSGADTGLKIVKAADGSGYVMLTAGKVLIGDGVNGTPGFAYEAVGNKVTIPNLRVTTSLLAPNSIFESGVRNPANSVFLGSGRGGGVNRTPVPDSAGYSVGFSSESVGGTAMIIAHPQVNVSGNGTVTLFVGVNDTWETIGTISVSGTASVPLSNVFHIPFVGSGPHVIRLGYSFAAGSIYSDITVGLDSPASKYSYQIFRQGTAS